MLHLAQSSASDHWFHERNLHSPPPVVRSQPSLHGFQMSLNKPIQLSWNVNRHSKLQFAKETHPLRSGQSCRNLIRPIWKSYFRSITVQKGSSGHFVSRLRVSALRIEVKSLAYLAFSFLATIRFITLNTQIWKDPERTRDVSEVVIGSGIER
jgi:hypothetical protein